ARAFEAAALQRLVEPVHGCRGHQVVQPEAARRGHRGRLHVRRQVDPRARAVALEPHAAAHVEAEVVAAHPQRIGADAPALAFAPAVDGAGEAGLVGNAEAAWPLEAEARARIELQ